MKCDLKRLCDNVKLRDSVPDIHKTLMHCTETCESTEKMLAQELHEIDERR